MANIMIIQIPVQCYNFRNIFKIDLLNNNWYLFAISLFIVNLTIIFYANNFYLPKKIKDHFMQQFAEFRFNYFLFYYKNIEQVFVTKYIISRQTLIKKYIPYLQLNL